MDWKNFHILNLLRVSSYRNFFSPSIRAYIVLALGSSQKYLIYFIEYILQSVPRKRTVIGIMQPPPKDGDRNALFSSLSKPGLDNYVVKRSKCHLLEEVSWLQSPCPIDRCKQEVHDQALL